MCERLGQRPPSVRESGMDRSRTLSVCDNMLLRCTLVVKCFAIHSKLFSEGVKAVRKYFTNDTEADAK